MCLARVEFIGDRENKGRQPLIDVARIDLTPSGIKVTELTGNVAELAGEIESIDFMDSVVTITDSRALLEGRQ